MTETNLLFSFLPAPRSVINPVKPMSALPANGKLGINQMYFSIVSNVAGIGKF